MYLCQLDYIKYYQAPPAMQKVRRHLIPCHGVLSTPDNESKFLLHQNGEFIRSIIFNMTVVHYQIPYIDCTIPYIDCTPSKTIVSITVQFGNNKNLDALQQFGNSKKNLNVLRQSGEGNQILDATKNLNFHAMQQLNLTTRELIFYITLVDKEKCCELDSNLDPKQELVFRDKAKHG